MTPISVTVVTLNEEKNIRRCLESVRWADEIIVVDSHSTDRTVDISREYTDRVIVRDWPGFAEQKNFAVEAASHDCIFSIDADEQVSAELAESIRRHRDRGFERDGYRVARRALYLGRWIRHGGWYPDYNVRLFNRTKARFREAKLHEKVMLPPGSTPGTLDGDLLHYTYADMSDHIGRLNQYTTLAAQELFQRGVKPSLFNLLVRPVARFLRMYLFRLGWLDGRAGLVIAVIGSFYVFLRYLKLWELHRTARDDQTAS